MAAGRARRAALESRNELMVGVRATTMALMWCESFNPKLSSSQVQKTLLHCRLAPNLESDNSVSIFQPKSVLVHN
jgi:hypothetical protein